jgi:hypothetical protein
VSEFEKQSAADREWLAFRYIAGELTGEELASFEAELETSQIAREAVARAVDLSQAIAIAEFQQVELVEVAPKTTSRKSWIYGMGLIGAGAVAASVAGAVWWNTQGPKGGKPELADIWVSVKATEPIPPAVEKLSEPGSMVDVAHADAAPSWMTAGVISLSGGKVEDGDGDGKPDGSWDDEVMEN